MRHRATASPNCGGCGNVCDTKQLDGRHLPRQHLLTTGLPAGRADCNQTAPNLDGCECPTPMCCGTACQPVHLNGLGQSYFSPVSRSDTPGTEASYRWRWPTAARAAWLAGTDGNQSCGNGANADQLPAPATTGTSCATWCYAKSIAGRVLAADHM